MSIINEALKKTQTNLDNIKEKVLPAGNDQIPLREKPWQKPAVQPSPVFRPIPPSPSPVVTAIPEAARASSQRKPAGKRWYFIVLAEILALGLIAWILFIIQPQVFRSSRRPKMPSSIGVTRPVAALPQPAPAASALRYAPPRNNLVLNGIMMNQNKMVALINGEIYEVGDYIGEQKVNKITLDRVELRDGDEATILSVRDQVW